MTPRLRAALDAACDLRKRGLKGYHIRVDDILDAWEEERPPDGAVGELDIRCQFCDAAPGIGHLLDLERWPG